MERMNAASSAQEHGLVLMSPTWWRGDLLAMLTLIISLGVGYPVQAMSEGPSAVQQEMWLLTGEILDIQGDSYTVEDGNGHEYRIVVDKNTRVPEPVQSGDMAHLEVDANNHARSMKKFGLFQFDEEFNRRLLKARETWVKKEAKAAEDELRKASLLLKAEALRADKEATELWKSQSEFENLASEIKNGVSHTLADVEAAFGRAKAASRNVFTRRCFADGRLLNRSRCKKKRP